MGNRLDGDTYVAGTLSCRAMAIPTGNVTNAAIENEAGIFASKLQQQYSKPYSQNAAADAVADQKIIHQVYGVAGTILEFTCGLITPPDTAVASDGKTAVVDLLKNGVSILSAAVTLDSTKTARTLYTGTVSNAVIAQNDVLEVKVTLGAGATGTAPKGVFANLVLREDAQ